MSGNCLDTATTSSGWLKAGSKFTRGRPLWATNTLTPRSWACCTVGKPTDGSVREKPWAVGLHAVYTLNAAGGPVSTAPDISSSVADSGPTLGAMMFWTRRRLAPSPVSVAVIRSVLSASGNGTAASAGPELGTSLSMATVVSLARKRSWRYAALSTQSRRGSSVHPAGSMPRMRPTVSGALWTQGPSGTTWWVCTSNTNVPGDESASLHAAVSCGGGTVNVPPRPVVDAPDDERRPEGTP